MDDDQLRQRSTGGPAFPVGDQQNIVPESGMTLRDYFAAAALAGRNWSPGSAETKRELANECYQLADAMLAEREG